MIIGKYTHTKNYKNMSQMVGRGHKNDYEEPAGHNTNKTREALQKRE